MRALATLLALLLLLGPLAAAQDDGQDGSGSDTGSSSHSSSSGPQGDPDEGDEDDPRKDCPSDEEGRPAPDNETEVEACKERYCRNHSDDERCGGDGEGSDDGPRDWQRWCRDEAREDRERGRCRQELGDFAPGEGRWVSFRVDAANATLLDYTVDGVLVADSIHLETGSGNLTVRSAGSVLRIGDEDTELVIHDGPTGLLRFKGDDGSLAVQLPADAEVRSADDGSAAQIVYAGGKVGHLRSENATFLDGHTVLATEFFALLLPQQRGHDEGRDDPGEGSGPGSRHDQEVGQAIEQRRIGAEITLKGPAARSAAMGDAADGNGSVEVLAYDDVEVQVRLPSSAKATPDAPIRVEVSAELDEGRTIVLNVNRSLLESGDPGALVLRYFDLHEQADGLVLETEVVFREASGLQDILDPGDDGGAPEYWVVEDANGLQVMASVPHWSAHAITVGSLAQALSNPSVLVGILVGAAGSAVAAVAMLWPRRQEE